MDELGQIASAINKGLYELINLKGIVYAESIQQIQDEIFFIAKLDYEKKLIIGHPDKIAKDFKGESHEHKNLVVCSLSEHNAESLRSVFPWTAPRSMGDKASFGTGDRLGIATPGHILAFKGKGLFPVLAQQSMREMGRTGRTPRRVIDDASWGVFEAGYKKGFGADADHIKKVEEAVECYKLGFTMFTIDASDDIETQGPLLSDSEAVSKFELIQGSDDIKNRYLGKEWIFSDPNTKIIIKFTESTLARAAVTYLKAVQHMKNVYQALKKEAGDKNFDFEVSVDETTTPTLPTDHFFIANELKNLGVEWSSLAPRFIGEFQKGIEYIGDVDKFTSQFTEHVLIARKCGGYKISVHSGSDKFSIFPVVGQKTDRFFHVKTAGTSWLEAVRIIARHDPGLYREMHEFALKHFKEDRKSYHVHTNLNAIQPLALLQDKDLELLLDKNDSRQLMHITYGSILSSKNDDGSYKFRDRVYRVLSMHEEDHYRVLERHIGRHIKLLT
jgi:hypothetical protein